MDPTTMSVFVATSPGQTVSAFTNGKCDPGKEAQNYLGGVGGKCHNVDEEFTAGSIQSLQYYVPFICDIEEFMRDTKDAFKAALKKAIQAGMAA
jgi:hypothetical protein